MSRVSACIFLMLIVSTAFVLGYKRDGSDENRDNHEHNRRDRVHGDPAATAQAAAAGATAQHQHQHQHQPHTRQEGNVKY